MSEIEVSKKLSHLLRHEPERYNTQLDSEGFGDVIGIARALNVSYSGLIRIIQADKKGRYQLSLDGSKVRAVQGHSISVNLNLLPVFPPPILFHGTKAAVADKILSEGLQKQSRQFVHLSADYETAVAVSKRRKGDSIIFLVDAATMHHDGFKFVKSENGIYLISRVPPRYLKINNTGRSE